MTLKEDPDFPGRDPDLNLLSHKSAGNAVVIMFKGNVVVEDGTRHPYHRFEGRFGQSLKCWPVFLGKDRPSRVSAPMEGLPVEKSALFHKSGVQFPDREELPVPEKLLQRSCRIMWCTT